MRERGRVTGLHKAHSLTRELSEAKLPVGEQNGDRIRLLRVCDVDVRHGIFRGAREAGFVLAASIGKRNRKASYQIPTVHYSTPIDL